MHSNNLLVNISIHYKHKDIVDSIDAITIKELNAFLKRLAEKKGVVVLKSYNQKSLLKVDLIMLKKVEIEYFSTTLVW